MDRRMKLLLMGIALVGIMSCSSKPDDDAEPVNMTFAVVDALLGPPAALEQPQMSIRAPKGWKALDSAKVAALEAPRGHTFQLKPRMIFMDDSTGSVLVVSSWTTDSTWTWAQLEARQRGEVDQAVRGRQARHDSFILAGQNCLQSLVQDSLRVNFKLLLAKGIQLDYVVPGAVYATQVEQIESSLGSLTFPDGSTQTQE